MKKTIAIILCAFLAGSAAVSLSGCSDDRLTPPQPTDSQILTPPQSIDEEETGDTPLYDDSEIQSAKNLSDEERENITDALSIFSVKLFKEEFKKKNQEDNVLLSPLSVYTAFSMLDNGAAGQTDQEIRNALGGGFDRDDPAASYPDLRVPETDELNGFFKNYMSTLGGEETKFTMANSVWLMKREDLHPKESFLNTAVDFYNAEIFYEEADDSAVEKINNWVSDNTDRMINGILSPGSLKPESISVLLNAAAFDGKWQKEYSEDDVWEDTFTNYDGSESKAEFMHSDELSYIDTENANGFIKYYRGDTDGEERYCFMALLPDEEIGIDGYIENYLTDTTFKDCYDDADKIKVHASMPKFSFDTFYNISESLSDMGINAAFDNDGADFSNMADLDGGNISIGGVIHKAHIEVDEKGTKAAAVTGIMMETNAAVAEEDYVEVDLDRPFVFAIYDYENNIPMFIGAVTGLYSD